MKGTIRTRELKHGEVASPFDDILANINMGIKAGIKKVESPIANTIMKKTKKEECYCLYIESASEYISFKIERGESIDYYWKANNNEDCLAVEHIGEEVRYLNEEDIFKTEKDAMRALAKYLNNKVKEK